MEAVKKAVRYCIDNDIMKDFLKLHSKEIANMLVTEWNWDTALKVREEEGREEGQNMVLELMKQGYTAEQIEARLSIKTETASKSAHTRK
jgi:hypothetical protein